MAQECSGVGFLFPLINEEKINNRLEVVNFLKSNEAVLEKLKSIFSEIGDIERLAAKISTGKINPRELIYFKNYLSKVSLIKNYLKNEKIPNYLKLCIHKLDDCSEIIKSLEHKINEEAPVLLSKECNQR